jgi:hypothetical protein
MFSSGELLFAESSAVPFSVGISMSNANADDSAIVEAVETGLRFWISDSSGAHQDWTSTFDLTFDTPVSGLKIAPLSPVNTSDDVNWTVSWSGLSDSATIVNSPAVSGEQSLYIETGRLPSGEYASTVSFRLDDDTLRAGNLNESERGDLNLSVPTQPWSISLPDGTTQITVQARLSDPVPEGHAFEGIGVDTSNAFAIPEPACSVILLVCSLLIAFRSAK